MNFSARYRAAMVVLYPFEIFDPIRKRWRPARWKATAEDIAARGARICGPAEIRAGGGTAAHLQSSPAPSEAPPADLAGAADLGEGEGCSNTSASTDPACWGRRLLP